MLRSRGFTLVELLAVCAVVAVALGMALLKLDLTDGQRLNAAAEGLAARLELARNEAVIRGETVAFSSDGEGYQFWIADAERNVWRAAPDGDSLASGRFPGGVVLAGIRVNGAPRPLGERLAFSFSGLVESFTLTLSVDRASVDIDVDALGRIEICHGR